MHFLTCKRNSNILITDKINLLTALCRKNIVSQAEYPELLSVEEYLSGTCSFKYKVNLITNCELYQPFPLFSTATHTLSALISHGSSSDSNLLFYSNLEKQKKKSAVWRCPEIELLVIILSNMFNWLSTFNWLNRLKTDKGYHYSTCITSA